METWTDRLGLEPSLVTASERALLGLKQTVEEVEGGQSFVIRSRTSAAVAIRILRPGLRHGSQVPECGACPSRPPQWPVITILCPACHARHDTQQRVAMTRRTRAQRVGQLWLTPELEHAPYASWMIPRRVITASQFGLFD